MEMLVTVGIFAIISTVVIVRNAQFDNETLLQTLAYDVALSVRQAQQFGVNVRSSGEGESGEDVFDGAYGVHFETDSATYFAFIDADEDGTYDEPEELIETYTLGRGATVGSICEVQTKENDCSHKQLDIVFRRPDPDAVINNGSISQATVELISGRKDGSRVINIESTGSISITRPADEEEEEAGGAEIPKQ